MPTKRTDTDKKSKGQTSAPNNKSYTAPRKNQHVVPRPDGWAVLGAGNSRDTVHTSTQREAIERAREIATRENSEVVVHGRDKKIVGRYVLVNQDWELIANVEDTSQKFIDFRYYGERPHIRGRRLLVSMVAKNDQADQWRISELARDFSITEEEVLAALLYYREHKTEIDAQDVEEEKQFDEMYEGYGTPGKQ